MDTAGLDWVAVWTDVAEQMRVHREAGRSQLLTEDTLRMCTILALEEAGIDPSRMALEVLAPQLPGGKIDLAIDHPGGTVIELKFPRDSRTGISPDTMTLGELIRDFLRVAAVPSADRWVVQVIGQRLRSALERRRDIAWVWRQGDSLELGSDALVSLPKTARDALGRGTWAMPVSATCVASIVIDHVLGLYAYRVLAPGEDRLSFSRAADTPSTRAGGETLGQPTTRTSARIEILNAIDALTTRSGRPDVTPQEVVGELRRGGSTYAESTIRTMMTSHMCAQVSGPNIASYDDLDRVDRARYRRRRPG